jgi:hypothetical protein
MLQEQPIEGGVRMVDEQSPHFRSNLFTVRLWREEVAEGWEYRGNVQDVVGGVSRSFRDWADLTSFMTAQVEGADESQRGKGEP